VRLLPCACLCSFLVRAFVLFSCSLLEHCSCCVFNKTLSSCFVLVVCERSPLSSHSACKHSTTVLQDQSNAWHEKRAKNFFFPLFGFVFGVRQEAPNFHRPPPPLTYNHGCLVSILPALRRHGIGLLSLVDHRHCCGNASH
jgi:hypothetical protein